MTATWQPSSLLPRDSEATVGLWLHDALTAEGEAGVIVSNVVPQPRPGRAVIINRDGGAWDGLIDRPRLRFRVYDASNEAAVNLARTVIRLLPQLVTDGIATRVQHLSGPLDVTDESEQPQMYLLVEIHLRGEAP